MTEARRPFALYAITKHGLDHAKTLALALPGADVFVSEKLLALAAERDVPNVLPMGLPMGPTLERAFLRYDCHVFIISVGAVVRMIAPLFKNKKVDPAVVCVDDAARFSICVLSGHVGRGNAFTDRIAQILGAESVVTTASDALGTLTVDILGRELGFTLDCPDHNVTRGCAAVVNEQHVALIQEAGEPHFWPLDKPLPKGVRYFTSVDAVAIEDFDMLLMVTDRDLQTSHPAHYARGIVYRPKSLVLGLGCDRNTPTELVARGVSHLMAESGLCMRCVKAIASIDKKADETALIALAEQLGVPFFTYTADELKGTVGIERPSPTVEKHVGTPGVSEPAALRCAGATTLLAPKRVYTEPGAGRSMTLAVARIPFDKRQGDAP